MVEREGSTPSPDTNLNPMQATQYIPNAYMIPGIVQRKMTLVELARIIATELQTSIDELRLPTRKQEIRSKRQIAIYLIRWYGGFTTTQIGGLFMRDHSTISSTCKVVEYDMLTNKPMRDLIKTLKESKLRKP